MKSLVTLIALAFVLMLSQSAEAQLFGRRQPQVVNQINIGGGHQQQFRQQVVKQRVVVQQQVVRQQVYAAPVRQQVVVRQQFVQPAYVQPVVVQQQAVCNGCYGGGGLQFNAGCQSFFAH